MATIKARTLVGIFPQVNFLSTCTMMLVATVRIRAASRMAEIAMGIYCIMVSMSLSSYDFISQPHPGRTGAPPGWGMCRNWPASSPAY